MLDRLSRQPNITRESYAARFALRMRTKRLQSASKFNGGLVVKKELAANHSQRRLLWSI
jgi:hypothetical protein